MFLGDLTASLTIESKGLDQALAKLKQFAATAEQVLGGVATSSDNVARSLENVGNSLTALAQRASAATNIIASSVERLAKTEGSTNRVKKALGGVGDAADKVKKQVTEAAQTTDVWVAKYEEGNRVLHRMSQSTLTAADKLAMAGTVARGVATSASVAAKEVSSITPKVEAVGTASVNSANKVVESTKLIVKWNQD